MQIGLTLSQTKQLESKDEVLKDWQTLCKLFNYDPETGNLYWKAPRARNVKVGDLAQRKGKDGYQTKVFSLVFPTHRVIWAMLYKELPPEFIDHKDRNPYDNTESNLRASCRYTNQQNTIKHSDGNNPFKGVDSWGGKWRARVSILGQRFSLGLFATAEQAQKACSDFRKEHQGDFARD